MIGTIYRTDGISVKQTINSIINLVQLTNQYLNASQFWKITNVSEQHQIIGTATEALRVISIFMYPVIPRYAEVLLKYFKVGEKDRRLENCKIEESKETVVKYDVKMKDELFIRKLKHI